MNKTSGSGRVNAPWLFGLLTIPYGFSSGVLTLLMPYLLRRQGVPVDRIAGVVALAALPAAWSFVCSPLVDLGLQRKTWLLGANTLIAALAGIAVLEVHGSLAFLTALLFLGSTLAGIVGTAIGALMTELRADLRGQASGWYQTGNLGAGAIGSGLAIWLVDHLSLPLLAAAVAAIVFVPMLSALLIHEEPRPHLALGPLLSHMFHDVRDLLRSPRTLVGLVFFLSPVGSAAVMNLISGVGPDYRASDAEVAWVTGVGGGLLCALGSLIGGFVSSRMNRMVAYALAGGLAAVCGLWLGFASHTPWTYGAGYSGYAVASGFAYAVFTALVLDVIGKRKHAAATAYSVLLASGNLSISYMTWIDGAGYHRWGAKGLMGVDALANGGGAMVLLLVAAWAVRFWRTTND